MFGYRKNVAGQFVYFQLNAASGGTPVTGATVAANVSIDGGAYGAATGTVTELGGGTYVFAPDAADLNGNFIGLQFSALTAITVVVNIVTTGANPTDGQRFGLTALPAANAAASGGLIILGLNTGNIDIDGYLGITDVLEIDGGLQIYNDSFNTGSFTIGGGMVVTGDLAVSGAYTGNFGAVWDVAIASHVTAGSTGEALNAAGGAGDPWITALPGAYAAGTAGNILGNNLPELHKIHGLKSGTDLVVTATSRTAGTISQTIATVAGTTTVSR